MATTTGGSQGIGTATLRDDGSGAIFNERGVNDPSAPRDDDTPRPIVVPPVAPARPPVLTPIVVPESPAPVVPRPTFDSAVRPTQVTALNRITPAAIGEIYTSSSGFRTAVIDAPQPALVLFKGVSDQFVESNRPTSFALPADTVAHTRAEAVVSVDARQSNGAALPAWVQFNAQAGTFSAMPPPGFTGQLEITVTARDNEGREAAATFKLNIGQGVVRPAGTVESPAQPTAPAAPPPGRSSLSEQLRAAWQPSKRSIGAWLTAVPLADAAAEAAPEDADTLALPLPDRVELMPEEVVPVAASHGLLARLTGH